MWRRLNSTTYEKRHAVLSKLFRIVTCNLSSKSANVLQQQKPTSYLYQAEIHLKAVLLQFEVSFFAGHDLRMYDRPLKDE